MSSPKPSTTATTSTNFQVFDHPPPAPSVPKLRSSCDACASSKVKCHKEKPVCSRCMNRGLACEYGTSMRGGRVLRTQDIDTDQPSRPRTTESSARTSASPADTGSLFGDSTTRTGSAGTGSMATASIVTTVPSLQSEDLSSFLNDCLDGSLDYMPDQDPFSLPLNYESTTLDPLTPFPNLDGDVGRFFLNFSTSVEASDVEDVPRVMPEPQPPFQSEDISMEGMESTESENADSCCLFVAIGLMRDLFPKSSRACTSSTVNGATIPESTNRQGPVAVPTIKDVITKNQRAIDTLTGLLQCSCAYDSYLLALISLIMSKVLTWYDAAAWAQQVRQAPAVINNYHLKGEGSGRMAAQLVLSELNRAQRLVNTLEKITHKVTQPGRSQETKDVNMMALNVCMDETMKTPSPRDESISAFSLLTLDEMVGHLQKKVKVISQGIVAKLNAD
ncbi:Aflatoxin biosynthesis regulatory protein [Apiospora phragmitis]|uniref:Aflatoxin biosynthesis regulatory protein n=1 Tax=Apiospora phragmitis TaxID=2905665 RepID=A0ABR1TW32_9PEZI